MLRFESPQGPVCILSHLSYLIAPTGPPTESASGYPPCFLSYSTFLFSDVAPVTTFNYDARCVLLGSFDNTTLYELSHPVRPVQLTQSRIIGSHFAGAPRTIDRIVSI